MIFPLSSTPNYSSATRSTTKSTTSTKWSLQSDVVCLKAADNIEQACDQALLDDQKTLDLGGELGTNAFADAVIERMNK